MNGTHKVEVVGETDPVETCWVMPNPEREILWFLSTSGVIDHVTWPKLVRITRDGEVHVATVDVMMHDEAQEAQEAQEEDLYDAVAKFREGLSDSAVRISVECEAIKQMLLAKNRVYGDSALDPVRIFSKADGEEQLRVRIDDKLSRLMRGEGAGEDVILDLIGYLILLRVSKKGAQNESL